MRRTPYRTDGRNPADRALRGLLEQQRTEAAQLMEAAATDYAQALISVGKAFETYEQNAAKALEVLGVGFDALDAAIAVADEHEDEERSAALSELRDAWEWATMADTTDGVPLLDLEPVEPVALETIRDLPTEIAR